MSRLFFNRLLLLSVILTTVVPSAQGHQADRDIWGDPVGEPFWVGDSLGPLKEDLTIDMRPCADLQPIRVEAIYQFRIDDSAKQCDLFFLKPTRTNILDSFTATLDGRRLPGRICDTLPLLLARRVGGSTPVPGTDDSILYSPSIQALPKPYDTMSYLGSSADKIMVPLPGSTMLFSLRPDRGEHLLKVQYRVRAFASLWYSPVYLWQLVYALRPPDRLGRLSEVNVRILIPSGWEIATTPPMQRRGDTLFASWKGDIPNELAFNTCKPVPRKLLDVIMYVVPWLLPFLVFFFSWRIGWNKGTVLGEERKPLRQGIPKALFCAPLSILICIIVAALIDGLHVLVVGNQGAGDYSALGVVIFILLIAGSTIFGLVFLGITLIPSGVAMMAAAIARSRAMRRNFG